MKITGSKSRLYDGWSKCSQRNVHNSSCFYLAVKLANHKNLHYDWVMKLAYLSDIFHLVNELNHTLQDLQKTSLIPWFELMHSKENLMYGKKELEKNVTDMFSEYTKGHV